MCKVVGDHMTSFNMLDPAYAYACCLGGYIIIIPLYQNNMGTLNQTQLQELQYEVYHHHAID